MGIEADEEVLVTEFELALRESLELTTEPIGAPSQVDWLPNRFALFAISDSSCVR